MRYKCKKCGEVADRVYVYYEEEVINKYEIDAKGKHTHIGVNEIYSSKETGMECVYCGSSNSVEEVEE